jgi:glutamate-1-semialdehyde 2,1-aminomutase
LAERVVKLVPGAECVQFFPSGTEACAYALRLVRAYTGKDKFIMCADGYHGSSDHFLGRHASGGIPKDTLDKALYVPHNDAEALERMVKSHKDELAAVFLEPILGRYGIVPKEGYLAAAREVTHDNDVPLVFDEVVTGFRIAPGGAQERFKIEADVATFGKVLGGGFPSGAMTFPKEMGELFTYGKTPTVRPREPKIIHPGTFNSTAITMAAGLATLDELTSEAYQHLEALGERMRNGIEKVLQNLGIKAQVTGLGSIFHIHFTDEAAVDVASADTADPLFIKLYDLNMLTRGVNLAKAHNSYCSTPMTDADIDQTLEATKGTLTAMLPTISEVAPDLLSD